MKTIYLFRHAETEFNCLGNAFIGGQSNHIELTPKGRQQSEKLGIFLKTLRNEVDKVICSDSKRTVDTLGIANKVVGFNEDIIEYTPDLREQSQGEWEGRVRSEIWTEAMLAEIMIDCFNHKAPGGESQKDVEDRVFRIINEKVLSDDGCRTALFMTHGNTIRCTLRKILSSDPLMNIRIAVNNASMTKLIFDDRGWKVENLNNDYYL